MDLQGSSTDVRRTECFTVKTKCGLDSTDVFAPDEFEHLSQSANFASNPLSLSDSCISTNERCPITSYELTQGRSSFDLGNLNDGFSVSLKYQFLQLQNDYLYTVTCCAEGGACDA